MLHVVRASMSITLSCFAFNAAHGVELNLKAGEVITIEANAKTTVSCAAPTITVPSGANPPGSAGKREPEEKCDTLYSDRSCQGARLNDRCVDGDKKGRCYRESVFSGKLECKCVVNKKAP